MPLINQYTSNVPNVYVNLIPPAPNINGVPTNRIGCVGTASWGPVNSPTVVGSTQQGVQTFFSPNPYQYDLMTFVVQTALSGANNFLCVRVTDGTDTAADVGLNDNQMSPAVGAFLTSIYTGSGGNTTYATLTSGSGSTPGVPTFRLTVYMNSPNSNGVPEVFDAIGGTGITFWQNLVNAVNNGQSPARGKSQLVMASLNSGISSVNVTTPGTYSVVPTVTASVGTGATFQAVMTSVSATLASGGTGFAVNDTVTLSGGTSTVPAVITVNTVTSGAIATFTITTHGVYTALPTNPVAQGSTSGGGSGATFNLVWGIDLIKVLAEGSGYDSSTTLSISGSGGGAATAVVGSINAPAVSNTPYNLIGGTDGNTTITSQTLIGSDSATPRTGMYALRGSNSNVVALVDADDPTYFTVQSAYGIGEGSYMISTIAPGYQDNIAGAVTIKQTSGINSYAVKLLTGDWVEINDTYNNQTRFISPQANVCAVLATQAPYLSSLNVSMVGIVATQKSTENRIYSDADLSQLATGNLDVITHGIPASDTSFGCRLGINTSNNPLASTDNYTLMNNYLALTIKAAMGIWIGNAYTNKLVGQVQSTISAFLQNLQQDGWIGVLTTNTNTAAPSAFSVIMDSTKAASGILISNTNVSLWNILSQLIVNVNANSGQTIIQISQPQLALAA